MFKLLQIALALWAITKIGKFIFSALKKNRPELRPSQASKKDIEAEYTVLKDSER